MVEFPELQDPNALPAIRLYLIIAVIFLDGGILLGGLNALRVAGQLDIPEIHQTHWTSTLFGGMTVIMMGQLLYFIGLSIELPDWVKKGAYVVLLLIILGAISSYISVWVPGDVLGRYFEEMIKLASLIYLLLVIFSTMRSPRKYNLKEEPAYIMIYAAIFWMAVAQLVFFYYEGIIGPTFRVTYVYGFFSLTLFGSLNFVLPRLLKTKSRPRNIVLRDTIMISLSAIFLLVNELVDEYNTLLGLLGTIFWGLVGFLFILYIFDLIYKTGGTNGLLGLSVALVMFGFFVFDTLMKSIFPIWVTASHAHFMFLGTLVISIIAIGIQMIDSQYQNIRFPKKFQNVLLVSVIILIGTILLGFTLQLFVIAGYAGIVLFVVLIIFQIVIIGINM